MTDSSTTTPRLNDQPAQYEGQCVVSGSASGELLYSDRALSFWGGVNHHTGQIIDHHHPLRGATLTGRILAIPSGRGSCTGSVALMELLYSGHGPAALIFQQPEHILTLGVVAAQEAFRLSIPVIVLSPDNFQKLKGHRELQVKGGTVYTMSGLKQCAPEMMPQSHTLKAVTLSTQDNEMLQGSYGPAVQMAMRIVLKFAEIQEADMLIDITQAHIDATAYNGPAVLQFAQRLRSQGAKFAVPTTLNAISLDYRRWKELGVAEEYAKPAKDLVDAYMTMGARVSFTCAPYLLESAPKKGEQIGWGESNAVVFANSVLGARTQKYADLLDICIAVTGRAPLSGCHRDADRVPKVVLDLPTLVGFDDSLYPMLGYCLGERAGSSIPLIRGLENANPRLTDLKAFGAAFATTASAPMFHIKGITPESQKMEALAFNLERVSISVEDITVSRRLLNTATDSSVDLISLGSPHFSIEEFVDLASYVRGRQKHPKVSVVVTTSRAVLEEADREGYTVHLASFGVETIADTCWCMLDEPIIPSHARNLMTNSAKYAHYAPGMVQRGVHFGSLAQCVDAACTGEFMMSLPTWLRQSTMENK